MLTTIDKNKLITDQLLEDLLVKDKNHSWSTYRLMNLDEDKKTKLTDKVVTKLFNDIKNKMLSVDYSFVDATKGDIYKLKNYNTIENAISYLYKIYNMNINSKNFVDFKTAIDELSLTFSILKKYNSQFKLGFKLTNPVVVYLYDSVVVALIQSLSFIISQSVEFVKDNINLYKPNIKISNNILKNNNVKSLILFNNLERTSNLSKFFKESQQFKENVFTDFTKFLSKANAFQKIITIIGSTGLVLYIIRTLVYCFYNARVRLSQYLKYLSNFVLMNASTLSDNDPKHVKEKQEKIAGELEKLADIISIDQTVSSSKTEGQLEDSNKSINISSNEVENNDTYNLGIY